jgi:DNA replication and repair protein RecF
MALRRLQVTDFRCLQSADLVLDSRFTLISGANASGKTSVLEAIYVLGRGRSFRTRRLDNLIRTGESRFVVFGDVDLAERRIGIGVEGCSEGLRARLGGERVASLGELASTLPVQIIDPELHQLIEEGPARRRRFIDWGVFHVEHTFLPNWQRYQKVLKQRNAALRLRQTRSMVSAWDGELVRLGTLIDAARIRYMVQLSAVALTLARSLLGMHLELSYRSGWARDGTFESALQDSWAHDVERGATSVGPQRGELVIRLDGSPVKDRISRGQQKLLAAALLVAQLRLFPHDALVKPTLLLDDPAAELDGDRLLSLISELSSESLQLIVTSLDPAFRAFGAPGRHYSIRQGRLEAVSR